MCASKRSFKNKSSGSIANAAVVTAFNENVCCNNWFVIGGPYTSFDYLSLSGGQSKKQKQI